MKKTKKPTYIIIGLTISILLIVLGVSVWPQKDKTTTAPTPTPTATTTIATTVAPTPTTAPTPTLTTAPTPTPTATTTAATTVAPTPTTAPTPTPTTAPTPTPTTAQTPRIERNPTSGMYASAMEFRELHDAEPIPRCPTLDALAQERAEHLVNLGYLTHEGFPSYAHSEGLSSSPADGAGYVLYVHSGSLDATLIGIGSATIYYTDGSRFTATVLLLRN